MSNQHYLKRAPYCIELMKQETDPGKRSTPRRQEERTVEEIAFAEADRRYSHPQQGPIAIGLTGRRCEPRHAAPTTRFEFELRKRGAKIATQNSKTSSRATRKLINKSEQQATTDC